MNSASAAQLVMFAGCGLAIGPAPASNAQAYHDFFGRSVIVVGDLDDDGVPDLVVSAPHQSREGKDDAEGALFAFSGADGGELYRVWSADLGAGIVGRLAAVGDVDGDGQSEFLCTTSPGATLCSGHDGKVVRRHAWAVGRQPREQKVSGLGDIDGDEVPDYVVAGNGRVVLFSGASGEAIRTLSGDESGDWFGFSLAGRRDADGDGVPDVLVGAPRGNVAEKAWSGSKGYARIHSGANGKVLVTVEGRRGGDCFAETVCFLGDVDGDGRADFAVGAPGQEPEKSTSDGGPGYVQVFSGGTGELLRTIEGAETAFSNGSDYGKEPGSCSFNSEFGYSIACAGDVDGDGTDDLAVGARREGGLGGSARVYSGKTGEVLHERVGKPFRDWGHLVGSLGDLDADGHDDFFHVGLNDTQGAHSIGHIMLISGSAGTLMRRLTSPLRPEGEGEEYF